MSALGGAAILLVDDDEVVRGLCRRSLEGEGARVVQAGDGEAALSFIQERSDQLDLVVTDLRMPRINGHELAEVLSIFHPTLPVLGMTGGPGQADRRLPTLVKPFIADLITEAARLMRARASEQRSWAGERRARAREAHRLAADMMDRHSALQQRVNLVAVARKLQGVAANSTTRPRRPAP
jgi:DNA-binding NtrC family response regulator